MEQTASRSDVQSRWRADCLPFDALNLSDQNSQEKYKGDTTWTGFIANHF